MNFSKLIYAGIASLVFNSAYAVVSPTMVSANIQIQDLEKILSEVQKNTDIPVLFPTLVPNDPDNHKYFAHSDNSSKLSYVINTDYTADCNGAKYCNVGYVSAEKNKQPEMMKNMQGKSITETVTLAQGIKAYFTPGHAMADFWPATIQWVMNGNLYSLTWRKVPNGKKERETIIAMANSMIISSKK